MKTRIRHISRKSVFYLLLLTVLGALCYVLSYELSYTTDFFFEIYRKIGYEPAAFYYYEAYGAALLIGIVSCFLYEYELSFATKLFTAGWNLLGSILFMVLSALLSYAQENIGLLACKAGLWICIVMTAAEMVFIIVDMIRNIKNTHF